MHPAPALPYPGDGAARRFTLTGTRLRIGRRSAARGVEPEIDLSGPPADPGISRLHALLLPAPDGTWALLDLGSANGIWLNGEYPLEEGMDLYFYGGASDRHANGAGFFRRSPLAVALTAYRHVKKAAGVR